MRITKEKAYQPYFQAYIDVHGIKEGEEVKFYEYASWITGMHNAFRKIKGCPYCNGYPPDVQKEFIRFIRGEQP